jgi:hypothetical protein
MAGNNPDGIVPITACAVLVVWFDGDEFCTLAHDNGEGAIRVYPRDQYDARLDLGRDEPIMFCGSEDQARVFMTGAPGREGAVQIPTRLAPAFGFDRGDLDADALAMLPEQPDPPVNRSEK